MARRALVIGGSISGLLVGLLLHQRRWEVNVFERVENELTGRGAGIVAQPELIDRLRALGFDTRNLGFATTTRKLLDASGRSVHTLACPQILTAWERVHRILREAFSRVSPSCYRRGKELRGFEQDATKVVAAFMDGTRLEADLLIGADGIRSTVRKQCAPNLIPLYAGYVAWRGLIRRQALPPAVDRDIFEDMTFCLPPGEQCLGYPVAGPENGAGIADLRYNLVWYRPADENTELRRLLTDQHGITHAISIPPPLIRRSAVKEMRDAAERLLAPQLCEIVRLIDEPILQPIYDLESSDIAFGRVAIVGDAAFVARPHVAAGVAKAADDAVALVEALEREQDVPAGLRRFATERLPVNRRIIERARHLGAYLQASQTKQERALSQQHSIPEAVLAQTAVLDFLYE